MVFIADKTAWSMPERFKVVCIPCKLLYKCSALPFKLDFSVRRRKRLSSSRRRCSSVGDLWRVSRLSSSSSSSSQWRQMTHDRWTASQPISSRAEQIGNTFYSHNHLHSPVHGRLVNNPTKKRKIVTKFTFSFFISHWQYLNILCPLFVWYWSFH